MPDGGSGVNQDTLWQMVPRDTWTTSHPPSQFQENRGFALLIASTEQGLSHRRQGGMAQFQ